MTKDKKDHEIKKWGPKEKALWLAQQTVKRSYLDEVVSKIKALEGTYDVVQYSALSIAPDKYPLFLVKNRDWDSHKETILVTGGVHGYETSGVHGALRFLETEAALYSEAFNIIVAPCVSPWGYETINRWNPFTIDPNRSFHENSPSEEADALMTAIGSLEIDFLAHIDLHETTDTDNTVFRPALAARDGITTTNWHIPDGFYLVGDVENPVDDFQRAMIESVKKVTHIAQPDEKGNIIGEPITQNGVINYANVKLSLCAGFSKSRYPTTTEVYPDSPKATPEDCIAAQVTALKGGLDYLLK